jgi:hypothetical protein
LFWVGSYLAVWSDIFSLFVGSVRVDWSLVSAEVCEATSTLTTHLLVSYYLICLTNFSFSWQCVEISNSIHYDFFEYYSDSSCIYFLRCSANEAMVVYDCLSFSDISMFLRDSSVFSSS